ncbi:MAG: hypothetical protein PHI35_07075 [Victivallaceae bacterium]|nr:hypothetical protein [Victivallaceae bacterium]
MLHQTEKHVFPGADGLTPSRSQYFSWLNNTNEGATDTQTVINLDFFRFLQNKFGMKLDIYAFDAGAVDGCNFYGSTDSDRFQKQFPQGFGPLAALAAKSSTRLGLWGGPDGFGLTRQDAEKRIEEMVSLCRDFNFELFKFDSVCGNLPPEHEKYFIEMMVKCRSFCPDLILLNHRLPLSPAGLAHATTFLWEGAESYIDVHSFNHVTAPHHRAAALARGNVPGLNRLAEDHGVCLSSCLDNWDDELVLQAFGRSLILAPEIYGNPWLLRDDELPKLARIFNLHRRFRARLIDAVELDESSYGPGAVSRGDSDGRFLTLRNLTWQPRRITVKFADLGVAATTRLECRRFHPREFYYGEFGSNASVEVEIAPFRSMLLYVGKPIDGEPHLDRVEYEVVSGPDAKPMELLACAATPPWIELGSLAASPVPPDVDAFYEAAVFAADANALEVRSLKRAGQTVYPEVQAARDAFFNQPAFKCRMCDDRNLFDGERETGFGLSPLMLERFNPAQCCFRLDLGKVCDVDHFVMNTGSDYGLLPLLESNGYFFETSSDLRHWEKHSFIAQKNSVLPVGGKMRYLKLPVFPLRIESLQGVRHGKVICPDQWHASVFYPDRGLVKKSFGGSIKIAPFTGSRKLCIALNGRHGAEKAFVAVRLPDGTYAGCTDRAPSFPCNRWEYFVASAEENYTCFLPLEGCDAERELYCCVVCLEQSELDVKINLIP